MPNATEMKFLGGTLSQYHTFRARDTLNFLRVNNIAFINDFSAKSQNLNPIEHLLDNFDQRVRVRPIPQSNVIQVRQALIQEWNNILQAKPIHLSVLCANDARQSEDCQMRYKFRVFVSDSFRILTTILLLFFHTKSQ